MLPVPIGEISNPARETEEDTKVWGLRVFTVLERPGSNSVRMGWAVLL